MKIKEFVEEILTKAVSQRASDLFIFPKSADYQLFMRNEEGIRSLQRVSLAQGKELLSYLKFMSQMDIAEHRRPQVGALNQELAGQRVFLRFSSVGDFLNQEALVIRLIYGCQNNKYFFSEQLVQLEQLCQKRGLIITSGPTGSGKTSTMYELARNYGQDKVVMAIEDPIEIFEPHFLQTQVNLEAGITYLSLLKAALRNRPDVLIIGEIRDHETAEVAVNAALSGHLVLATVHAKSSLQTISRLEGLGIKRSMLANSLTAVSYQRLMPSQKQGLACLFDVVAGDELKQQIKLANRSDFIAWSASLQKLKREGEISEETYRIFQAG